MTKRPHVLAVCVAAAVLFVLRFGYEYGAGDQDELFSLLLHQLDPSLFSRDGFVLEQGTQFTVRTPFLWLMQGVAWALPLWAATLLVYVLGWLAVAWGVFRLSEELGGSTVAASLTTLLVLVAIPTWTLGGNSLAPNLLAPEMLGWALALPAVRLTIERQLLGAGVLLALAAYLHLLVGALVTGALGLAILLGALGGSTRDRWRHAFTLGGTVLVLALPMIVAIARYRTTGTAPADGPGAFFLFAELRLPHHYLPSTWPLGRWARFGLLALLGAVGLATLRRRGTRMRFAERLLLAIALICVVAAPLIGIGEALFVAQLQPFKLTVLANAVLASAVCTALASALPASVREGPGLSAAASVAVSVALVAALGVGLASGALDARVGPWARADDPLTQAERWISEHVPADALVAVPPNTTTFRLAARRSVVGTFKAAPFNDAAMQEWYARLLALAPRAAETDARGLAFGHQLGAAYGRNTRADWDRLVRDYGVTHVLRDQTRGEAPEGLAVFEAGTWVVYAVTPSTPGRGGDASSRAESTEAEALEDRPEG